MRKKGVSQLALQLNQNNSFSTIMQFDYNYTHDVILTSLIVIHILKYHMWHYEEFLDIYIYIYIIEILINIVHYDC